MSALTKAVKAALSVSGTGLAMLMLSNTAAAQDAAAADTAAADDASIRLASADPAPREYSGIESVTVTARRRDESAQDVPIPIATLSGDSLERAGDFRLEDLNRSLPSTNVLFGNPRQTSVAVRGLGNNPANDALEASVGVYLDNVYLGRPGMANLDLIDVDQVALLRGPQGTLFGKNTTAGVLNITTKQPTFQPEAQFESSFGNRDYYQVRGAISGPIIDDVLAGRLSAVQTSKDGFVENLPDGRDLNGSDRKGFRGQLLYTPTEALSVRVIGDYAEEHSDASISSLYSLGPNDGALVKARYAALGIPLVLDDDYRSSIVNSRQHMDVRQGGGSIEANYEFGSGHKLTSITAYRSWWFLPTNDGDATNLTAIINAGQHVDDEQWSQELRIASPTGGAVDYVAGLYYFYQYQSNQLYQYYGPDAGAYLGRAFLNNATTLLDQQLFTNSYSAFGQATWHASDRWSFTGGVRETFEDKSTEVRRNAPIGGGPGINAALGFYETGKLERSDNNPSFLLSTAFQQNADLLWYASASKGAKSGGINPDVPKAGLPVKSLYIEPEKATDFELGFKSTLLDRRLQLNANLYWTDVKDYQATGLELSPVTNTVQQVLSNIGKVRSRGVETEVTAVPLDGLTLSLNASYNDAKYRDYRNAPCGAEKSVLGATVCDLSGEEIVGAPKWIVNPSITYDRSVGNFDLRAQTDYAWRSSFFGAPDNSEFAKIDSYGVLNARLGVGGTWANKAWEVSLWGRNLLDKAYVTGGLQGASQFLTYSLYSGEPRAYGAALKVDF
ncbi:MAG: TonB-dependent receptor [Steroidobacteraceae bacterium]